MTNQQQIVLASSNPGKLNEIKTLLADLPLQLIPQDELNINPAEETGLSFVENAIIKARHAAQLSGHPAIADDSGLAINALDGRPGIYSSRFAGEHATDDQRIEQILKELEQQKATDRSASFYCVCVYLRHGKDPAPIICQGIWRGEILPEKRGEQGFGYDPIFYVPTHDCSAAELPPEVKNKLSHRGQAFLELLSKLQKMSE